jgi:hypothetical protein
MIADLEVIDAGSELFDSAGGFVAEHHRCGSWPVFGPPSISHGLLSPPGKVGCALDEVEQAVSGRILRLLCPGKGWQNRLAGGACILHTSLILLAF